MHDLLPFSGGFHYRSELEQINTALELRIKQHKAAAVADARLSIVAPSEWALNESKNYGTFSSLRHTHIFNGVPLDIYKPIEKSVARRILNLPEGKKIVLFVADSLDSKRKGMNTLCDAIVSLRNENLLFVSMGGGKLPIDSSVEYQSLGSMADDTSLAIAYASADVVVVPSIEDNSPNTIIESFACGRPVVGMAVGGIPQLISSSGLGVIVKEATAKALADGILEALRTDYSELTIRQYAEMNFSLEKLGADYFGEFTQAMHHDS
jgi:glycosyltransferase involved in cell wall biosynthesis